MPYKECTRKKSNFRFFLTIEFRCPGDWRDDWWKKPLLQSDYCLTKLCACVETLRIHPSTFVSDVARTAHFHDANIFFDIKNLSKMKCKHPENLLYSTKVFESIDEWYEFFGFGCDVSVEKGLGRFNTETHKIIKYMVWRTCCTSKKATTKIEHECVGLHNAENLLHKSYIKPMIEKMMQKNFLERTMMWNAWQRSVQSDLWACWTYKYHYRSTIEDFLRKNFLPNVARDLSEKVINNVTHVIRPSTIPIITAEEYPWKLTCVHHTMGERQNVIRAHWSAIQKQMIIQAMKQGQTSVFQLLKNYPYPIRPLNKVFRNFVVLSADSNLCSLQKFEEYIVKSDSKPCILHKSVFDVVHRCLNRLWLLDARKCAAQWDSLPFLINVRHELHEFCSRIQHFLSNPCSTKACDINCPFSYVVSQWTDIETTIRNFCQLPNVDIWQNEIEREIDGIYENLGCNVHYLLSGVLALRFPMIFLLGFNPRVKHIINHGSDGFCPRIRKTGEDTLNFQNWFLPHKK